MLPLLFLLRTIAFTLLLLRLSKRLRKKAKAEENAKAEAAVAEEVPTMDEVEMPSIEPISLDDTMVVSPAPESTMPSIEDEIAEKRKLRKLKIQIIMRRARIWV